MATPKKISTVNELTDKVTKAKSMVFADYRGLKHKQLEDLRRKLKKTQGEFVITKNRLLLRALGHQGEAIRETLNDATATLFAYADEVGPVKELVKFFKDAAVGKTKGGLLGTRVMNAADVDKLAKLPNRETILAQLAGQLNAPIQSLHYALSWNMNKLVWALNAVKNKKSTN